MPIDRRRLIVTGLGASFGASGLAACADDGPSRPMPAVGQQGYGPDPRYNPAPPYGAPPAPVYGAGQGYAPPPPYGQAPAYGQPPAYDQNGGYGPDGGGGPPPGYGPGYRAEPYTHDEIIHNVSDFFGVAAETAGGIVERIFADNGLPTGYIAGTEGSGAVGLGLRYGKGLLYMKRRPPFRLYWRGPSIGWDLGGNASRVFTLCYNLQYPEAMLQRFPGVDGSIYVFAGLGVNYQRANDITLAPIRSGVGLRAGANVGYLAYSRDAHIWPF